MWIYGADGVTEAVKRSRPISLGGKYHFYDIPPGQYRITARLYGHAEGRDGLGSEGEVEDGRPTELVLTPATALVSARQVPAAAP